MPSARASPPYGTEGHRWFPSVTSFPLSVSDRKSDTLLYRACGSSGGHGFRPHSRALPESPRCARRCAARGPCAVRRLRRRRAAARPGSTPAGESTSRQRLRAGELRMIPDFLGRVEPRVRDTRAIETLDDLLRSELRENALDQRDDFRRAQPCASCCCRSARSFASSGCPSTPLQNEAHSRSF